MDQQAAESKSAPADYVAMALLGGVAGVDRCGAMGLAVGGLARAGDRVGDAGRLAVCRAKSPAMDAVRDPLADVERDAAARWPETRRAYETAKVVADARRERVGDAKLRAAVKAGRPSTAEASRGG